MPERNDSHEHGAGASGAGREVELQYVYVGRGRLVVPVELAELMLARSERATITDTYFDTAALELRDLGCSLRIRAAENESRPVLTWKGPASTRGKNGKARREAEWPLERLASDGRALEEILRETGAWKVVAKTVKLGTDAALEPIGQLRHERSAHSYVHGLHELQLCWDRLSYPLGPAEVRLEVEAVSPHVERYLDAADRELRELFGSDLVAPKRGKVRELCERLYPELLGEIA